MQVEHVHQYFQGERREMIVILASSAALVLLAAVSHLLLRDGFTKAVLVTVLVWTVLLSAMAGHLLVRDTRLRSAVVAAAQATEADAALAGERVRVVKVVSGYASYRFGAAALGLVALVALIASRKDWMHGVAAGLLLLVVAQTVIDHYSELRARRYLASLTRG